MNTQSPIQTHIDSRAQEYDTEFEILRVDHFRSPQVAAFLENVVLQSGGIFKYGWSLGAIRYASAHLVATNTHHIDIDGQSLQSSDSGNVVVVDETALGSRFRQPCVSAAVAASYRSS
jgi:hypothetical protein